MRSSQPSLRGSLNTVSVVDAVADALRKQVLDGLLAPGTSVTESQVATGFNVARPTAKAAITVLVHEGILRRQAHRAALVPQLSADDVADIYLARIPTEVEAIEQLVARNLAPEAALAANERLYTMRDNASHSEFAAADLQFHRALVDAVDSERLSRLYGALEGEIHLCMVQAARGALDRESIAEQHQSIFEALRERDRETAAAAMRSHLIGARDALQRALSSNTGP